VRIRHRYSSFSPQLPQENITKVIGEKTIADAIFDRIVPGGV
jgi:hypothetical protein